MLHTDRLRTKSLQTLIENRTMYSLQKVELNLFETYQTTAAVALRFDRPVLASMIRGRKIMHLRQEPGFAFLPGESILLPAGEPVVIDFPDATSKQPTKCLALEIDAEEMRQVAQLMNERRPRTDGAEWSAADYNFHFAHDPAITQLLQRLVYLCAENHPSKDLFVNMLLRELLIRVMESESRQHHLRHAERDAGQNPIDCVITYVRNNLDRKLTVGELSRLACMSESGFYRSFKNEVGCSPVEFINAERLRLAANLLLDPSRSIREVALRCGFNSVSYFTRVFGECYGNSPGAYQADRAGVALTSTAGT
ncbi:AraC family transcriptional regulator [Lewinella sp. JB7]|uniref:AraC family transcriptional regulator n=1 Tax=Lewinella sp. JB7 TaxID=2962887 RepID=UPI0020C9B07F|nr:AraC family transcriptional regulator [Lewinella sp. JB7]MCP9236161.1 AraC family transcriptional regulator [Lewinella sp. JB7]